MGDQVPDEVKRADHRLIELQNQISLEYMQAQVGKIEEVFVDEITGKTNKLSGRTRTNKQVLFSGSPDRLDAWYRLRSLRLKPESKVLA